MAIKEIEAALSQLLRDDATVGSLVGDRIYPITAPQNQDPPYIIYERVSGEDQYTMDEETDLHQARVQFRLHDTDYGHMKDTETAVREVFRRYSGTVTIGLDSTAIDMTHVEEVEDNFDAPLEGTQETKFWVGLEVLAFFRQEV